MPVTKRNVSSIKKTGSTALKGDVTLSEGSGVTLTQSGNDISIAATSSGSETVSKSISQTTHGFAVGDVLKYASSTYAKAQADSAANAEVVGIVSAVADANTFTLLTNGYISTLSGLTANTTYFLSASSAGALTSTEPSTAGQVSVPLLRAVSTTAGHFHLKRGVVVPSATSTGETPNVSFSTMFEASGRWSTNHASGTATYGEYGVRLDTTATGSRRAHIYSSSTIAGSKMVAFDGSPSFSVSLYLQTIGTTGYTACGIGDMSGGGSTTTKHIGFFIETSGGTTNLYASNASGTTQTKSASLTTFSSTDVVDLFIKKTSTTSIDFYWRKNGGSWSSATTHTTNIPSGTEAAYMSYLVANTTDQFQTIFQASTYKRQ